MNDVTHLSVHAKSDYERYILSLPDRTNLTLQHFGDVDINDGFAATTHYDAA